MLLVMKPSTVVVAGIKTGEMTVVYATSRLILKLISRSVMVTTLYIVWSPVLVTEVTVTLTTVLVTGTMVFVMLVEVKVWVVRVVVVV